MEGLFEKYLEEAQRLSAQLTQTCARLRLERPRSSLTADELEAIAKSEFIEQLEPPPGTSAYIPPGAWHRDWSRTKFNTSLIHGNSDLFAQNVIEEAALPTNTTIDVQSRFIPTAVDWALRQ